MLVATIEEAPCIIHVGWQAEGEGWVFGGGGGGEGKGRVMRSADVCGGVRVLPGCKDQGKVVHQTTGLSQLSSP